MKFVKNGILSLLLFLGCILFFPFGVSASEFNSLADLKTYDQVYRQGSSSYAPRTQSIYYTNSDTHDYHEHTITYPLGINKEVNCPKIYVLVNDSGNEGMTNINSSNNNNEAIEIDVLYESNLDPSNPVLEPYTFKLFYDDNLFVPNGNVEDFLYYEDNKLNGCVEKVVEYQDTQIFEIDLTNVNINVGQFVFPIKFLTEMRYNLASTEYNNIDSVLTYEQIAAKNKKFEVLFNDYFYYNDCSIVDLYTENDNNYVVFRNDSNHLVSKIYFKNFNDYSSASYDLSFQSTNSKGQSVYLIADLTTSSSFYSHLENNGGEVIGFDFKLGYYDFIDGEEVEKCLFIQTSELISFFRNNEVKQSLCYVVPDWDYKNGVWSMFGDAFGSDSGIRTRFGLNLVVEGSGRIKSCKKLTVAINTGQFDTKQYNIDLLTVGFAEVKSRMEADFYGKYELRTYDVPSEYGIYSNTSFKYGRIKANDPNSTSPDVYYGDDDTGLSSFTKDITAGTRCNYELAFDGSYSVSDLIFTSMSYTDATGSLSLGSFYENALSILNIDGVLKVIDTRNGSITNQYYVDNYGLIRSSANHTIVSTKIYTNYNSRISYWQSFVENSEFFADGFINATGDLISNTIDNIFSASELVETINDFIQAAPKNISNTFDGVEMLFKTLLVFVVLYVFYKIFRALRRGSNNYRRRWS